MLRTKVIAASLGVTMAGAGVYAATNWVVGVASASAGQARSASNANLIISATASPVAGNLLYPGATGDVVVTIANPNPYPVTITAVQLPPDTTDATGYTTSALTTSEPGCLASTPSTVTWNFATSVSGSSHALTTPLTVGASGAPNNPLVVTLTNDATMGPPWGRRRRWRVQTPLCQCPLSRASPPLVDRRCRPRLRPLTAGPANGGSSIGRRRRCRRRRFLLRPQLSIQIVKPTRAQGTMTMASASIAHDPTEVSGGRASFAAPKKHSCSLSVSRLRLGRACVSSAVAR
jgi:hypothetical protein